VTAPIDKERFYANVAAKSAGGCWLWGAGKSAGGYGVTYVGGRRKQATHVAFYLHHGRWPASGLVVLHSCDVPGCVNPEHLREGTQSANVKESYTKGRRNIGTVAARKRGRDRNLCRNGHVIIPGFAADKYRCFTCMKERGRCVLAVRAFEKVLYGSN
jgi:hypothetical protein